MPGVVIVNSRFINIDVFSLLRDGEAAYVNYLMVQNGTIVQTHTIPLQPKLDETDTEILSLAVVYLRTTFNSLSKEIIVPFEIDYPEEGILITIPKSGDKKKLLELSEKNVNYFYEELRKKKILKLEGKDETAVKRYCTNCRKTCNFPKRLLI